MHLFRWLRFLSLRKRGTSSPRRSSRGFFHSLHRRCQSGHPSIATASSPSSARGSSSLRPSVIHIEESGRRQSCSQSTNDQHRSSQSHHNKGTNEADRQFLEDVHRDHVAPETLLSPTSTNAAFARMSSMFKSHGRSAIMDRATIFNMFNELQFDLEAAERNEASNSLEPEAEPPMHRKRSKKKLSRVKAMSADAASSQSSVVGARSEPSRFCQYWASARAAAAQRSKRPLTAKQTRDYLQGTRDELHLSSSFTWEHRPSTNGSRRESQESVKPEPIQFLFFGGSSDENPYHLRDVGRVQRYYHARVTAESLMPSCTTSIRIKPSLVRNLPPVFEPSFA